MKTIAKEEEYDLIYDMLKLEKQLLSINADRYDCLSAFDMAKNESIQKGLIDSLTKVTVQLVKIDCLQTSRKIVKRLVKTFFQMKTQIFVSNSNYSVSRRQGFDSSNYFAAKIQYEIKCVVNINFQKLRKPFLYLTDDASDSFDRCRLIALFETEINILNKIQPVNYITIRKYYNDFECRLKQIEVSE